jgi:hypothetical protein
MQDARCRDACFGHASSACAAPFRKAAALLAEPSQRRSRNMLEPARQARSRRADKSSRPNCCAARECRTRPPAASASRTPGRVGTRVRVATKICAPLVGEFVGELGVGVAGICERRQRRRPLSLSRRRTGGGLRDDDNAAAPPRPPCRLEEFHRAGVRARLLLAHVGAHELEALPLIELKGVFHLF